MIGGIYLLLLGLKTSIDHEQLFDRIRHQPDIIELHTFDKDYTGNRLVNLEKTIEYLKSRGIEVLVHGPLTLNGETIGGLHFKKKLRAFYHYSATALSEIAKKLNVNIVIHPNYKRDLSLKRTELEQGVIELMDEYDELSGDRFLWENDTKGIFSFGNPDFLDTFFPNGRKMCFDTLHALISLNGNNEKMFEEIEKAKDNIKHFHLIDSMGLKHDSLQIGKGIIDWKKMMPYLTEDRTYVFEIDLPNQTDCIEMLLSYEYLKQVKQTKETSS